MPEAMSTTSDEQIPNTNVVNFEKAHSNDQVDQIHQQIHDQYVDPPKMMGLGDLNLGEMGLDDMSRISMGNIESKMNNDQKTEQFQITSPAKLLKIEEKPIVN